MTAELKVTPADGPLEGSYKIIGGTIYKGCLFFAAGVKDQTGVRQLTSQALNHYATATDSFHILLE
jgi:hypothetical protein